MIRTVADLLARIVDDSLPLLAASGVTHAPTIGDMYEGLSAEILRKAIPGRIDLRVVTGFAVDGFGNRSGQLDCMVVRGEGVKIPFTDSYEWNIKDVIAVVEVKKTLRKSEMSDALEQLQSVRVLEHNLEDDPDIGSTDVRSALKTFAQITGRVAPIDNLGSLSAGDNGILQTLLQEQTAVIRIVIGLHGYATEEAFRDGLVSLLEENLGTRAYSPAELPQLIISGKYSLAKMNGRPYVAGLADGPSVPGLISGEWWPFYCSSPVNPLIVLLEVLWYRLDELYDITDLWGEDLDLELFHPLLLGQGTSAGWHAYFVSGSEAQLSSAPRMNSWQPAFVSAEEFVVVQRICQEGVYNLENPEMQAWLQGRGASAAEVRGNLLRTKLVAADGDFLRVVAADLGMAILPSGEYIIGENNTGRFLRWIELYTAARKSGSSSAGNS